LINFRFKKTDLRRLFSLLKFDSKCILNNGSAISGEEVFLRGLYELSSGENHEKISANIFGREFSAQSRAFSYFTKHLFTTFQHLLTNNMPWVFRNGLVEDSAEAIGRKLGLQGNLVSWFIDWNCLPTSVVGGGPCQEGANSARWDYLIQRAFFNGRKSVHGLKHQTCNDAHGLQTDCAEMTLILFTEAE